MKKNFRTIAALAACVGALFLGMPAQAAENLPESTGEMLAIDTGEAIVIGVVGAALTAAIIDSNSHHYRDVEYVDVPAAPAPPPPAPPPPAYHPAAMPPHHSHNGHHVAMPPRGTAHGPSHGPSHGPGVHSRHHR